MSRRRETYRPATSPTADELLTQCYGVRRYHAPAALTIDEAADPIREAERGLWRAIGVALVVEIVGMLAVAAAAWRWLGV
jgi:hypothetical protein